MRGDASAMIVVLGALVAGAAVALGAFGAHALDGRVPEARIDTWNVGARYQMYHGLGLVAVGLLGRLEMIGRSQILTVGALLAVGVVLFSGSLYALVLTETPQLGAVAPLGGGAMIAGWGVLAWSVWRGARPRPPRT